MKKLSVICFIALAIDFATGVWFTERRDTIKQLVSMAALGGVTVLMLVSFVLGLERYRREKIRAFIPLVICVIGLPTNFIASTIFGGWVKDTRFQKNLPRYNEVAGLVQTGAIKPESSNSFITLPNQYVDLAWGAILKTNSDGIIIEFWNESGFPVKHSGYLYASSGNIENDARTIERWPFHSRINSNWFRISD